MIGSNHFEIDKTILDHLNDDSQRIALLFILQKCQDCKIKK